MTRFARRIHWCVLVAVAWLGFAGGCLGEAGDDRELVSSTSSELTRTFASGSMVIPLDTTSQDTGALRAYGLVYKLLSSNVPVQWAIRAGKAAGATDVTISAPATVNNLETGAAIAVPINYRGGPFIIDAADRAAALPIVNAWLASDAVTVVHTVTGTFTADIAKTLTAAPRVAVLQDGFEAIAIGNFNAAGITDSTGAAWAANSVDVLSEAVVAGPTTTSHVDGGLWNADGTPRYCNVTSMHYNATARTPEVVAEVRGWLAAQPGNHAFMQCQATATFENAGHFLTTAGIVDDGGTPTPLTNRFPDDPLTQSDGTLQADTGAVDSIGLAAGSTFAAGVRTLVNLTGAATTTRIVWLSGRLDGASTNGKVTYLGGHTYATATPLSANPLTNGVKVMLDSLFETGCATPGGGQPVVTLTKAGPALTNGNQITYTITYANTGTRTADPDNDKDGVLDVADACPLVAGPAENHGCPDTDRDGDSVADRLDNCPDEKGPPENQGCPRKQLVKITDDKLDILESVYFKTDRAEIEPRSFGLLDNVAAVLVAHDQLHIQVEGHTDSQGDDAYNKKLSQRRAEAVVAYLVKKGIAAARLTALGFGEEKPIADNRTKEGRAQNRRVVFTVIGGGDKVKTHEQGAGDDTK